MAKKNHGSDVSFIRELAVLLREHDLTELEVARDYGENDNLNVRVARQIQKVQQNDIAISPATTIVSEIPSNTEKEAYYTAAALHFFKSCTKSDFGVQAGDRAGTPPPILKFNCYGHVHASNVPVVIRSFNYTLPEDTDYVEIDIEGEMVAIPTLVLAAIELTPQLPPKQVKDNFNIKTFASGGALKGGNSGGFI